MRKPLALHPWADEILTALAQYPASREIVLGGYFALQHYIDYRQTRDVDAWWRQRAHPETIAAIRHVMEEIGGRHDMKTRERTFGETLSVEWEQDGVKVFSFQIAVRSVTLESPRASLWPPIMIESVRDNVAAKMNALVDRGAPRDFVDIEKVVQAGLVGIADCWTLWSEKNGHQPLEPAKKKGLFHLAAIEARRPLESIEDSHLRADAQRRRSWFRDEFLKE